MQAEDRRIAVDTAPPGATATTCLAITPPEPGSELYAPYLLLAARLLQAGASPGVDPGRATVHIPLLDDPAIFAVSTATKADEGRKQAEDRLDAFLNEALAPELGPGEIERAQATFGLFLGTIEPPDQALAMNPYGAAFALGRREQLGLDPVGMRDAFRAISAESVRRVKADVFGPARRVHVLAGP